MPDAPRGGAAAATTGQSMAAAGLWSLAGRVLPQLYTFVVSVVAARVLGPNAMGQLVLIVFSMSTLLFVATVGVNAALTRYVAESVGRNRERAVWSIAVWAWRCEAAFGAVAAAILVVVALSGQQPRAAWLVAAAGCAIGALQSVPSSLLVGAQRWRDATVVSLVTGAASTAGSLVVLALGGGISELVAVQVSAIAGNFVGMSVLGARYLKRLPSGDAHLWHQFRGQVVRYALFTSATLILLYLVEQRTEIFFLARFASDADIAVYSIAFSGFAVLALFPAAVAAVVSPAVATLYGGGQLERIEAGFERAVRVTLLSLIPVTGALISLGPTAVRLIYGGQYRSAGPVVAVLAPTLLLVSVGNLSFALLAGLGRVRGALIASAVAAVSIVPLNVVLVPRYQAVGAALAYGIAQAIVTIAVFAAARAAVRAVRLELRWLGRIVVVSTTAGLAALAAVSTVQAAAGLLVGLTIGTAVLVAGALTVGVIPPRDAVWLQWVVGRRFGDRPSQLIARAAYGSPRSP